MTQHSNVPHTAARDSSDRGNGVAVHNASHLAARHTTAADSHWQKQIPAASSVSSAVTLTAALRK